MTDRAFAEAVADLRSADPAVRGEAARRLGESASTAAFHPLLSAIHDPDDAVRSAVDRAIASLAPTALREALENPEVAGPLRSFFQGTLAFLESGGKAPSNRYFPETYPPNVDLSGVGAALIRQAHPQLRCIGATLIGGSSFTPVEDLHRALDDPAANVRQTAAKALGKRGSSDSIEPLLAAMQDAHGAVRTAAMQSLSKIGNADVARIFARRMTSDDERGSSADLADSLVRMGEPAAEALQEFYPQASRQGRERAIDVARRLGGKAALGLLRLGIADSAEELRRSALRAIEKGASDLLEPHVSLALQDESFPVRLEAVRTLERLEATGPLRSALANDRIIVRVYAAIALAALNDPAGSVDLARVVREALTDPATTDDEFQNALGAAIASRTRDPQFRAVLDEAVAFQNAGRRRATAEALAARADRTHFPLLTALLRDEDELARQSALKGLLELKGMRFHPRSYSRVSNYVPPPRPEGTQVHFSLVAPAALEPGQSTVVTVWAHFLKDADEVVRLARGSYGARDVVVASKSGDDLAFGAELTVRLSVPGLVVDDPEDSFAWRGSIANAGFPLSVPKNAPVGTYPGIATVRTGDARVVKLHFVLEVGERAQPPASLPTTVERTLRAFASYASVDRADVFARIQGMQKSMPELDVFVDVASLRSGEKWAQRLDAEIAGRDVFYLFWSAAASSSEWVKREWQRALELKGIDYIDPVPLVAPYEVPPPPELAALHFNDWALNFMRSPRR